MRKKKISDFLSYEFKVVDQSETVSVALESVGDSENVAIVVVGHNNNPLSLTDRKQLEGLSSNRPVGEYVAQLPRAERMPQDLPSNVLGEDALARIENVLADKSVGVLVVMEGTEIKGVLRREEMARVRRSLYGAGPGALPGDPSTGAPEKIYHCKTGRHQLEPNEVDLDDFGDPFCRLHGDRVYSVEPQ